jgi:hypothetical protein
MAREPGEWLALGTPVVHNARQVALPGRRRGLVTALAISAALVAAGTAEARAPVIAYVDPVTEKLALYDAETGAAVPAPDIAIPGPVRRYAVSHDGSYVLYADEGKKLHLFDRGSGSEVPLPGADKYENPGSLTVSDTGLIAFDDNGNGPALVYDSGTGSFVDVGLPAENDHRQTRLSGDGRFLATTCPEGEDTCAADRGADSSLFVQDIVQKSDVPVPDDLTGNDERDEEHPCIDGDGTLVGIDIPNPTKRDVFLFDRGADDSVFPSGLNDPEENDVNCTLDSSGLYVGWQVQTETEVIFKLLDRGSGQPLSLPSDDRFELAPIWLTDPYPPSAPAAPADRVAPRFIGRVRVTNRRFRARASAKRAPVGTRFVYRLSEAATVTIAIERRAAGRRLGGRCVKPKRRNRDRRRCARWVRRGRLVTRASAGRNSTPFSGRLKRRALRSGRHRARLLAVDAAGNRSQERRVSFRIVAR